MPELLDEEVRNGRLRLRPVKSHVSVRNVRRVGQRLEKKRREATPYEPPMTAAQQLAHGAALLAAK